MLRANRFALQIARTTKVWTTEVECQTPARSTSPNSCSTGPALWEFFRKTAVLQEKKKALAYRGKGGQNTGTVFPALRLGVALYLLTVADIRLRPAFLVEISFHRCPQEFRNQLWLLHGGGPSKKGKRYQPYWG